MKNHFHERCTFTGRQDFSVSGDDEWAVVRQWRQSASYTNVITYGQGIMKVRCSGAAGGTTVGILRSTLNWNTVNMVVNHPAMVNDCWHNITNIYRLGGTPITITSPYVPM